MSRVKAVQDPENYNTSISSFEHSKTNQSSDITLFEIQLLHEKESKETAACLSWHRIHKLCRYVKKFMVFSDLI